MLNLRKPKGDIMTDKMDIVPFIGKQPAKRSRYRSAAAHGGMTGYPDSHQRHQSSKGFSIRTAPRM